MKNFVIAYNQQAWEYEGPSGMKQKRVQRTRIHVMDYWSSDFPGGFFHNNPGFFTKNEGHETLDTRWTPEQAEKFLLDVYEIPVEAKESWDRAQQLIKDCDSQTIIMHSATIQDLQSRARELIESSIRKQMDLH